MNDQREHGAASGSRDTDLFRRNIEGKSPLDKSVKKNMESYKMRKPGDPRDVLQESSSSLFDIPISTSLFLYLVYHLFHIWSKVCKYRSTVNWTRRNRQFYQPKYKSQQTRRTCFITTLYLYLHVLPCPIYTCRKTTPPRIPYQISWKP
jgi:hypothetical protein